MSSWNPIVIVAAVLTISAAALVVVNPIAGFAIALSPLLLLARDLPTFGILIAVLILRALVDGNSGVGVTTSLTALLGGGVLILGIAVLLRSRTGAAVTLVFLVLTLLSNYFAVTQFGSDVFAEWVRFASVIVIAVIVLNVRKTLSETSVTRSVQLVGIVPLAAAAIQAVTGTGKIVEGVMRPAGTLFHPNSAAVLFALLCLVSLASFLDRGRTKIDLLLTVSFAIGVIVTGSIGGATTLLAMIGAYGVFRPRVTLRGRLVVIGLMFLALVVFVSTPIGQERLGELAGLDVSGDSQARNSLEWRFQSWNHLLEYWRQSPVLGQGFGATTGGDLLGGYIPHNEYVRLLVETGILGAVIAAGALIALFRGLIIRRGDPRAGYLPAVAIALCIGLLVNGLGANTLLYSVPSYVAVLIIAAAFVSHSSSSSTEALADKPQKDEIGRHRVI